VIGAGWWAQGWHLPQLQRNPDSEVVAIMQRSEAPKAWTGDKLETKTELRATYGVPVFSSVEEMLSDAETAAKIDGVIICTSHNMHAVMGHQCLAAGKHILMEKPMTVDVAEARELAEAASASGLTFIVNNTANFRDKCFDARRIVASGELGEVHQVLCVMYSPLMFLFDDPKNSGWTEPTGKMVGNGFGWGQLSHVLAWVLHVADLDVEEVTAMTHKSEKSGADLTDAALIRCKGAKSISLSGGCGWPGHEFAERPAGKHFDIKIFGSNGVLMYGGDDKDPASGRLELRKHDGTSTVSEGFLMENTEVPGLGPESLLQFIAACRGLEHRNGADQGVGLQAVRALDAMYRSAASGKTEPAL